MTHKDQIIRKLSKSGLMRYRDIVSHGIHPQSVKRMVEKGELIRIGRGLYALHDADFQSIHQSFAEACALVPQGVICLLSALAYHAFTTQSPPQIWMAIPEKAKKVKVEHLMMRYVRFSSPLLDQGVDTVAIGSVKVKITTPARTVADCFKYRNKIGLDAAVEALRDGWHERRFTMDELNHYAVLCRVNRIMQPYLEAIV